MPKLLEQGRKYALTVVFLALSTVLMVATYVLALAGKLTPEFTTICSIVLPSWAGATIGFQASNAYSTGKAAQAGVLGPPSEAG